MVFSRLVAMERQKRLQDLGVDKKQRLKKKECNISAEALSKTVYDEEDSKQREFGWKIENSPLDLFIQSCIICLVLKQSSVFEQL